jgi:hypothetical protein
MKIIKYEAWDAKNESYIIENRPLDNGLLFLRGVIKDIEPGDILSVDNIALECTEILLKRNPRGEFANRPEWKDAYFEGYFKIVKESE